jgi:hypothetical protein
VRVLAKVSIRSNLRAYFVEKYAPYSERADDMYIEIFTDRPEYHQIVKELVNKDVDFSEWRLAVYSKIEFDSAEILDIETKFMALNPYGDGDDPGQYYDRRCEKCNIYVDQRTDLMIKKKDLGTRDLLTSWENELLISCKLKAMFESERITGIQFRPVYTKGEVVPVAYQLVVSNVLPPCERYSDLTVNINCSQCGFKSYAAPTDKPLKYPKAIQENILDFNRSSEYFGMGFYPRPIIVMSQRVRQLLIGNKVKGVHFTPIALV